MTFFEQNNEWLYCCSKISYYFSIYNYTHDDSIDRTLKSIINHTEDSLTAVHFKGTPKAGSTQWIFCASAHTLCEKDIIQLLQLHPDTSIQQLIKYHTYTHCHYSNTSKRPKYTAEVKSHTTGHVCARTCQTMLLLKSELIHPVHEWHTKPEGK